MKLSLMYSVQKDSSLCTHTHTKQNKHHATIGATLCIAFPLLWYCLV